MMSEPAMYLGGMILSSEESAYQYEASLKAFLEQRVLMFNDDNSFWGHHSSWVIELERAAHFPDDAYYYMPEDPLVTFPDYQRCMLLKRRYLNRLRMRIIRLKKQGKSAADYTSKQWRNEQDDRVLNHINSNRKKNGLKPTEKFW